MYFIASKHLPTAVQQLNIAHTLWMLLNKLFNRQQYTIYLYRLKNTEFIKN